MSDHRATIEWQAAAAAEDFVKGRYSREHTWAFDGGVTVAASPSPSVVPAPWSNPAHVDPEEAFVASVSSCHMLTFLYVASKAGFAVERYRDEAVGTMTKGEKGPWISKVTLSPSIVFAGGKKPSAPELEKLHHAAHDGCFIANSIKTLVVIAEPPGVVHAKLLT
jgi:organic hydroperoxide reductase OsmC/OhrA